MQQPVVFTRNQICSDLNEFINYAQRLGEQEHLAQAIQVWEAILSVASESAVLAQANFHLARIYREWNELFAAQRFLGRASQLDSIGTAIKAELDNLNRHIAENRVEIFEERERKNSNQIVSLFRIATGLKLLQMDKAAQAYPLMKSRTKIYPNAAVAKHLLTGIIITEDDKNSAIEFLEERDWLANTEHDRYSITDNGLYVFYMELAKLHVANEIYDEAAACYEQAYWLDDSSAEPLYHLVICDGKSQAWENGLAALDQITDDIPEGIDRAEYHSAIARIYGLAYQSTQDQTIGLRAITACESALAIDKKNKAVSKLLKSLRSEETLQTDSESDAKPKKRWWRR